VRVGQKSQALLCGGNRLKLRRTTEGVNRKRPPARPTAPLHRRRQARQPTSLFHVRALQRPTCGQRPGRLPDKPAAHRKWMRNRRRREYAFRNGHVGRQAQPSTSNIRTRRLNLQARFLQAAVGRHPCWPCVGSDIGAAPRAADDRVWGRGGL